MFVHLRLHTEFSIVDSTCRIESVVAAAKADSQPALAMTDLNNLFGAIKFYKQARECGVKPIIGADLMVQGLASEAGQITRLLVLVQNNAGYLNLCELLARAWTQNVVKAQGVCRWAWLQELSEGLIVLSGAQAGPLGQALSQGDSARACELASVLSQAFPERFYIEVQRAGRADDEAHVSAAAQLAAQLDLPLVATHPVQFLQPDDYEAHEARVCIAEGEILGNPRRVRKFTTEQYFKTQAQMQALFADLPSALANSAEIAVRCNLTLSLGKPQLPDFPTPEVDGQRLTVQEHFAASAQSGLDQRLLRLYPDEQQRQARAPQYRQRLDFEISTILKMGFAGYFLIVADFIRWAKNNGCPVGPGRGSGAGSLVAYALEITDLDPLSYELLFERFLNPERVSMPDFDIDFCQVNRDRVIDYVKLKYGKDAVSQIATFGTMAARAAIRDVGRVLDMSYTFCDGLSKLIPNKPGQHITIDDAIKAEPVLAERVHKEEEVRTLLGLARKLEGLTRNVGMHAGGVLIAPGKLTRFTPLYQQPGSEAAVSQYDKDDVESAGLVKFDFLGLATLTIMTMAKDMIVRRHPEQADFSYEAIALTDSKTYRLFAEGKTEAVFQFESSGMQAMLREAKPTRLEDLIALNALYRPGPMDVIPSYIARKHGREPITYPHPLVEPVLSETYGIMVYQEQVMQTAQILGGYSLGGADLLRRAMGKKKADEMAQQRETFRTGAARQGIAAEQANEIFDLMEKFAGYGFNKSHAAAYSLLAYHTAWLKVHYSAEFYCANMTVEMDNTDKLKALYEDALKMGLRFEPPDVNHSDYAFEPITDNVIRYSLGAVKGTGEQAIAAIVQARRGSGPYTSLYDFCVRVDRTRVNKRAVEALIKAGAFDRLHTDRASMLASLEQAFDFAVATQANVNQAGLFDMGDSHAASTREPQLLSTAPWGVRQRLISEKAALGFYFSGHLFDEVAQEVRQFCKRKIADLVDSREPQLLAGIISDFRYINGKRGKVALFRLDDKSEAMDAVADEALVQAHMQLFKDDEIIVVMARMQPDRFSGGMRLVINQVWDLADARCRFGKHLLVQVGAKHPDIGRLLRDYAPRKEMTEQGELVRGLGVRLSLVRAGVQGQLQLGDAARFYPSDAALQHWRTEAEDGQAQVVYE